MRRVVQLSAACTGLYCAHHFKTYRARCESPNAGNNINITSDTLLPSFKAVLISKLYNFDFTELKKQEVLIEIGLLSIPVILTGIASTRLLFYTKRAWNRKDFYNIVNVSLNTVIRTPKTMASAPTSTAYQTYKYTLYFRTLMEKEVRNVIPNEEGIKQLIDAAKRTNTENPFIVIKNHNHYWTVCNQIANQISALCATSFIHRDIVYHNCINTEIDDENTMESCTSGNFLSSIKSKNGVNIASNIETGVYIMALTCEPERSIKHKKIRVMLIQQRMIQQLLEDKRNEEALSEQGVSGHNSTVESGGKSWSAKLEDPVHSSRWELIMKIVNLYDKQERRENGKIRWAKPLCDLELCTMSVSDNMSNMHRHALDAQPYGDDASQLKNI